MRVSLLAPGPIETVSGGYAYDREMIAGLGRLGHAVDTIALAGSFPLADAHALGAVRDAWAGLPDHCVPVIDGLALPAFDAATLATRPSVGLIHHPTALETGHGAADRERLRAIECDLMPSLARIVVTSTATAEQLVSGFGVSADRIRIVVPGTADAPRRAPSNAGTCHVLSVGALVPRKGHDVLIRALARLFDLDWRLTIVGDATRDAVLAGTLAALAEEVGVAARVTLAGAVNSATLDGLWAQSDVFALATHHEGYGMAIAEALKRGLPVAVTAGGAAASLVTPDSGSICQPGDVDQLSKALRRLIFDGKLRADMAEAAWIVGQTLPDWPAQARAFAAAIAP